MNLEEIRRRKAELDNRRRELRLEMEDLQDDARRLMRRCSHPNKYETSVMGERTHKCPDCGWSR